MGAKEILKSKKTTVALVAITVASLAIGSMHGGGKHTSNQTANNQPAKIAGKTNEKEVVDLIAPSQASRHQKSRPSGVLVSGPEGSAIKEPMKQLKVAENGAGTKAGRSVIDEAFNNEAFNSKGYSKEGTGNAIGVVNGHPTLQSKPVNVQPSQPSEPTVVVSTAQVNGSVSSSQKAGQTVVGGGYANGIATSKKTTELPSALNKSEGQSNASEVAVAQGRKPIYVFYTKEELEKACKELSLSKKRKTVSGRETRHEGKALSRKHRSSARMHSKQRHKKKRKRSVAKSRNRSCNGKAGVRSVVVTTTGRATGIVCRGQGAECVLYVGGKEYEKGDVVNGYEIEKITLDGVTLKDEKGGYHFIKAEEVLKGFTE